jgi:hypothetical protein
MTPTHPFGGAGLAREAWRIAQRRAWQLESRDPLSFGAPLDRDYSATSPKSAAAEYFRIIDRCSVALTTSPTPTLVLL